MSETALSKRVVYAALASNLLVAVTKFIASAFTGSSSMLSEAVHSLIDTVTPSPALPWAPFIVCYIIIISGICVQLSAKVVLGLSFGIIAANRGVKHEGPYRFVRHPMYAGYTMAHIGLLLAMPVAINAFWYGIAFLLQIARMNREERVLKQSQEYRDLVKRVSYRLVPGIY